MSLQAPTPDFLIQWGLRTCISNKFQGDADAAGMGSHFENPGHRGQVHSTVGQRNMGEGRVFDLCQSLSDSSDPREEEDGGRSAPFPECPPHSA